MQVQQNQNLEELFVLALSQNDIIYKIKREKDGTPIENRKDKNFAYYYDLIWKDLAYHE